MKQGQLICPFLSIAGSAFGSSDKPCQEKECAIWDEERDCCSFRKKELPPWREKASEED